MPNTVQVRLPQPYYSIIPCCCQRHSTHIPFHLPNLITKVEIKLPSIFTKVKQNEYQPQVRICIRKWSDGNRRYSNPWYWPPRRHTCCHLIISSTIWTFQQEKLYLEDSICTSPWWPVSKATLSTESLPFRSGFNPRCHIVIPFSVATAITS